MPTQESEYIIVPRCPTLDMLITGFDIYTVNNAPLPINERIARATKSYVDMMREWEKTTLLSSVHGVKLPPFAYKEPESPKTIAVEQIRPNLNHNDWTPLPEEWVNGPDSTIYQLINMQRNDMLPCYLKVLQSVIDDSKNGFTSLQRLQSYQYALITRRIMLHRKLVIPI